jgi:hypothetical protein
MKGGTPTWHLLQLSDVLDMELAQGLSEFSSVVAWEPERSWTPWLTKPGRELERMGPDCDVRIRRLPLLRGYARPFFAKMVKTAPLIVERLQRQSFAPEQTPLICTIPYFAEVAELWPGPVVYWLTDLIAEYAGADREQVKRLDRRMCSAATLVCPNSERLAEYLMQDGGCDRDKICVLPNATRAYNLMAYPLQRPGDLPTEARDVQRPVAGVIGNLAGNMDWVLLEEMIDQTPWLHWLFVGPTSMQIPDVVQAGARTTVMKHPRARFVGRQPYGKLASFARSFEVAVLPYRRCEPTYSGSSTRFYEHLAACRPMIATRGFAELLKKRPLLELIDTASEGVSALEALREKGFDDGCQTLRWKESRSGTWTVRAWTMQNALADRVPWLRSSLGYLPDAASGAAR